MVQTAFDLAIKFTLPAEGGFTHDDGGDTMCGVTQTTYTAHGYPGSVRDSTPEQRKVIQIKMYWDPAHCGDMPNKLAVAHFDWSFNHGVEGGIKTLQEVLGITANGIFGPQTLSALNTTLSNDDGGLLEAYQSRRVAIYHEIVAHTPSDAIYLDGWLNRVHDLNKYLENIV